jgi:hypothetical protein
MGCFDAKEYLSGTGQAASQTIRYFNNSTSAPDSHCGSLGFPDTNPLN